MSDDWAPPVPEERRTPPPAPEPEWRRLDPRMLLVGPVSALKQFAVPAIAAVVGLSSSQGGFQWWMLPVLLVTVLAVGALPWLTTGYRTTDQQFQLRTGLLSRRMLSAPLDRVRSVDLEASLLHRLLGLAKVKVGTGVDETRIDLNALGVREAEELRRDLLARRAAVAPAPVGGTDGEVPPAPADDEELLATLDWSWLRFAPLNLARMAIVAGAIGFLAQFLDDVPVVTEDRARSASELLLSLGWPLLILSSIVAVLVGWLLVSLLGYALQWGGLRLTRDARNLHLSAGLLTTRSITVEEARIRGLQLDEPALMRLARGGELRTLATGVDHGTTQVLPPSPIEENRRVGAAVLGSAEPLTVELVRHGRYARRRSHVRHQWTTLFLTVASIGLAVFLDWPAWLPVVVLAVVATVQAVLAELWYRHLGHALTTEHLVSASGALARRRTALERDGVIGWVVQQSFFQRRVGLATLVATTAAGPERVEILDVPYEAAVRLAAEVTPRAVDDFLDPASVA